MNKQWAEVERQLEVDSINCRTIKLTIAGRDLYYKIGYAQGRPVFLDITFGQDALFVRSHEGECLKCKAPYINLDASNLETQLTATSRALLEVTGRMATAMLQSGVWNLDHLISMWKATRFEPSGLCMQLAALDSDTLEEIEGSASIVKSPLDAFAKFAERRRGEWEEKLSVAPPPPESEVSDARPEL